MVVQTAVPTAGILKPQEDRDAESHLSFERGNRGMDEMARRTRIDGMRYGVKYDSIQTGKREARSAAWQARRVPPNRAIHSIKLCAPDKSWWYNYFNFEQANISLSLKQTRKRNTKSDVGLLETELKFHERCMQQYNGYFLVCRSASPSPSRFATSDAGTFREDTLRYRESSRKSQLL